MKSVVLQRFGEPGDVMRVEDVPLPEPGPGQVRLRVAMSPIHNHDLTLVRGLYGTLPALPHRPGTEAVGVVDAVGDGVTALKAGDRVAGGVMGGWAECALADAARLVAVPPEVADETACQLSSMPMSAVRLLNDLDAKAGDWIVQNAANGLVGKLLAQLAAERGVRVLNVVRRAAAIEEMAEAGIGDVVSTDVEGWQERARAITGGAPILRAVDSIGGKAVDELMDLVAETGRLVSFGSLSREPIQISNRNLLYKRATISGFWAARPDQKMSPEQLAAARLDLVRRAADGRLRLPVAQVFPLAEAAAAAVASTAPGRGGKIVIRPDLPFGSI
jgi:NADPH:quinone reductase-like Zn-dependent oxidoreductase